MSAADLTTAGVPAVDMTAVLERRFQRERLAKEQAEKLLESKSLELYRARQQTEAERKLLLDAIGTMRDGFAILDPAFRLLIWNSAFLRHLGLPADEQVQGVPLSELLEDLRIDDLCDEGGRRLDPRRLLQTEVDMQVRLEARCRDGRVFLICFEPSCATGRPLTLRDITVRRKLEQDLEAARKHEAIGTMAGGIAHEINTPVQYITNNLEFIQNVLNDFRAGAKNQDTADLCEEAIAAVRDSLDGANQIARIVSAIRLYSHPGSGNRELADIGNLLQSISLITRNQWSPVAGLELDLSPDLGLVGIYQDSLKQVFLNLVVNAAQAISEAGPRPDGLPHRILISAYRQETAVTIKFEDSGPGIPVGLRDKIFDMFFTTKPPGAGTGQGLAISRRIVVDDHGGSIECGESALGGAMFLVQLPSDRQETASSAPAQTAKEEPQPQVDEAFGFLIAK